MTPKPAGIATPQTVNHTPTAAAAPASKTPKSTPAPSKPAVLPASPAIAKAIKKNEKLAAELKKQKEAELAKQASKFKLFDFLSSV